MTAAGCRRSSPFRRKAPGIRWPRKSSQRPRRRAATRSRRRPDILSKMSGKDNPQMLLGAYRQPDSTLQQIDRGKAPLWIVAQALRDPGNIGTILRTGDAAGAGGLDPDRRQRRSFFRRGCTGVDGRPVHAAGRNSSLAGIPRVAARRRRPTGRHQPQSHATTISRRITANPASSSSATSSKAFPPTMRRSATCSSKSRWPAAPTASTPRWPRQ